MPVRAATTLAAARGPGARLDQVAQGVDREADVFVVLGGGGGADDEDDLAFDVAAEAARQLAEGAAGDLLVHLGQLAADGGLAVGGERGQRRQGLADPARATRRRRRSRSSAGPAPSPPPGAAGSPRSASGRSAGRRRPAPPGPPRARAGRSTSRSRSMQRRISL